jgi:UDP-GlcNAc3NAcA epimerase
MSLKVVTIVGARPQFIKAKPLCSAIAAHNQKADGRNRGIDQVLVHTGQHYDYGMSKVFFEELDLPVPDYALGVGSGNHGWQMAEMLKKVEEVLLTETPDVVVVFGDTNSTLAGALAAAKLQTPVAHVEAGLRSFNRNMPEEINRVLTDHLSALLFAPNRTAVDNLNAEGIRRGILEVGDVMYEAAMGFARLAETKSDVLTRLGIAPGSYVLATVHRAENTDSEESLTGILKALDEISSSCPVIWPVHPRTSIRLGKLPRRQDGHRTSQVRLVNPVSYLDMLQLERSARVVITDSGGVQKEACWFEIPCITLRDETEWVDTVQQGRNQLAGTETNAILDAFARTMRADTSIVCGNANQPSASTKIVAALAELELPPPRLVRPVEPFRQVSF